MRKVSSIHDSSNSYFWSDTDYYVCDSEQEYEQKLSEVKAEFDRYNKAYQENPHGFSESFIHNYWCLYDEQSFDVSPKNRCSDGWHFQEGHYIKGFGFEVYRRWERSSRTEIYLKPGALVRDTSISDEWLG